MFVGAERHKNWHLCAITSKHRKLIVLHIRLLTTTKINTVFRCFLLFSSHLLISHLTPFVYCVQKQLPTRVFGTLAFVQASECSIGFSSKSLLFGIFKDCLSISEYCIRQTTLKVCAENTCQSTAPSVCGINSGRLGRNANW